MKENNLSHRAEQDACDWTSMKEPHSDKRIRQKTNLYNAEDLWKKKRKKSY